MIHKKDLLPVLFLVLFLTSVFFLGNFVSWAVHSNTVIPTSSTSESNWGLSFQEEGKPPVANTTAEELKQFDAYYMQNTEEKNIYIPQENQSSKTENKISKRNIEIKKVNSRVLAVVR